jgi:2-oxoglutarate dehydrogenase E1 component
MVDIEEAMSSSSPSDYEWLRIARIEQLFPFPQTEVERLIKLFPKLEEIVWVQEEPKNMGSWLFMEPRIRALVSNQVKVSYIGRQERASTASGHQEVHVREQQEIISSTLNGQPFESNIVRG